jgi:hypothetical protein
VRQLKIEAWYDRPVVRDEERRIVSRVQKISLRCAAFVVMHKENHTRMARMQPTRLIAILPVFICIFLTGCIPIKVATQAKPVTGAILQSEPDTSVIRVGVTTRAEINQQFATFDTGWKGERLFLGRWLRSGVGVAPEPHKDRWWHGYNLVVKFDEKGAVTRYQVLSDREFVDALPTLLSAEEHLSGLQQPTGGTSFKIDTVMGKEFLELSAVEMVPRSESWRSRFTRDQIERLSTWEWGTGGSVTDFNLKIHLRDKVQQEFQTSYVRQGKRRTKILSLHADVPTIVLLIQFLQIPNVKH